MAFSHVVLLKPSDIRFTTNEVQDRFDNNIKLTETLAQLENKEITIDDIPNIQVVWSEKHWDWYTLNNRRLWVFQELEKKGLCRMIKTHRFEEVRKDPKRLYGSVEVLTRNEIYHREYREVSVTSSRCVSPEKSTKGQEYELRETKVKIERNIISADDNNVYSSYQETRTCRYSEYKPRKRSPPRQRTSQQHRHLPYRTSSLARLVPSRRFYSRVQELQKYPSYRRAHGLRRVFGIVSYGFWQRRRSAFFHKFWSVRSGRVRPRYLPDVLHTCGVCFKSFKRRVSLEQHCEELLHYACVSCGRFFTSSTALGQHRLALDHYLR